MSDASATAAARDDARPGVLRRLRWPLILGGPLILLLVIGYFWLTGGRYESTDDAYVQIAKAAVAPAIGGRVAEIRVHENQVVKRGDLLFRLDSRDQMQTLAAAQAAMAQAELNVRGQGAAYQEQAALVQGAQESVAFTAREAARQRKLAEAGVASRQQVDLAAHEAMQAQRQLAAVRQQAAQALAALGGEVGAGASHPSVMQARAQLTRAQLNVSYTNVLAPADGVVTRVDQLAVGSFLNPSQTAFWLLSGQPWIEANYKEDQLAHMRVGQPVRIRIDALPDTDLPGHVASFSPGTGSVFSPLPAQNATGNWVKVVQRLPVRIVFDRPAADIAHAGLSAHVRVDVRAPSPRS